MYTLCFAPFHEPGPTANRRNSGLKQREWWSLNSTTKTGRQQDSIKTNRRISTPRPDKTGFHTRRTGSIRTHPLQAKDRKAKSEEKYYISFYENLTKNFYLWNFRKYGVNNRLWPAMTGFNWISPDFFFDLRKSARYDIFILYSIIYSICLYSPRYTRKFFDNESHATSTAVPGKLVWSI